MLFNALSKARHETEVAPDGNTEPEAGVHEVFKIPEASLAKALVSKKADAVSAPPDGMMF